MTDPVDTTLPLAPTDSSGWQGLPARGRWLFGLQGGLAGVALAVAISMLCMLVLPAMWMLPLIVLGWLVGPLAGGWLGLRVHRFIAWRLDHAGFSMRRGRAWFSDTRVPHARVQHVDVKHGPLARRFGLATLVLHTAGTRDSAVSVPGLDADDAARLRDILALQHTLDADD